MKNCDFCNKELLVYWSKEGSELCDECFYTALDSEVINPDEEN
jgi:hypothetical protein